MVHRVLYLVAVPFRFARLIASQSLLCVLFVLGPGSSRVHAGLFGSADIGTEEFQGLQIISAARPAGLAWSYTALGDGVDAVGINPAGLARESARIFYGSLRYHPDLADAGEVAYSQPFGEEGRLAFSATYINFGTISYVDENNQSLGEDLKPSSFYPVLTYARSQGDKWNWGASVKGALEDPGAFDGAQKAVGAGADAGIQYRPARNFGLGASVVNAGIKLRGHSLGETAGSGYLPGAFKAGTFFHPQGLEQMSIAVDAELPFFNVPALALGYEYRVIPEWDVRAGTRLDYNDIHNLLEWGGAIQSSELNGSAMKVAAGTSLHVGDFNVDFAEQWWTDLGFVSQLAVSWCMR